MYRNFVPNAQQRLSCRQALFGQAWPEWFNPCATRSKSWKLS
jgi:hypothetical protein